MTDPSQSIRIALLICTLGFDTGCITGPDVVVSDSNDAVLTRQELTPKEPLKHRDIALVSDNTWEVYRSRQVDKEAFLGRAQLVCSNATSPANCPDGAVNYGFGGADWFARIDACNGSARWIWAPGVTGTTAPAEMVEYYFANRVSLPAIPTSAQIHLAVDDQAEVIVNGKAVGVIGSTTDSGLSWEHQSKPTVLDLAGFFGVGTNSIVIRASNGTGAFGGCANCTYQQNPAGVVFCVDIRFS